MPNDQQLTAFEQTLLDHLNTLSENDTQLKEGLNNPDKNITQCAKHIANWARAQNRACFTDEEVFGQAIHYFTEKTLKKQQYEGNYSVKISKTQLSEADQEYLRKEAREQIYREEKERLTAKKQKASHPELEQQAEFDL